MIKSGYQDEIIYNNYISWKYNMQIFEICPGSYCRISPVQEYVLVLEPLSTERISIDDGRTLYTVPVRILEESLTV
jgi:hypothetical protein